MYCRVALSIPTPVERFTLDNGLRVVLHRDTSLPLVAINIWYHVGSKNESPGLTGFAHLFEHMLFQGSQHVGTNDHFRWVQQAGGVANGSTWFDRTNYYETLPSNWLDLGLWLESDRMGFLLPAMDLEKLENQRSVVINERRQTVDNQPYGRAFERLHELLYPASHPYHWPVIGYVEDIEAATLEDVTSFFETYYVPNNAVLSVVGDISIDSARSRIEHWFGDIASGAEIRSIEVPAPTIESPKLEIMPDQVELARIYMAYSLPAYGELDWYAADLLSAILSGGKSSLLHEELVYSQQIATDISSFVMPTELSSTFYVVATARPETKPEDLEKAILDRLAAIAASGVSSTALTRSKNKIVTAYRDELQKLDQLADLLSMFTTYFDDPGLVDREVELYSELGSAEISELISTHLQPDRRITLFVVPDSNHRADR
ncbi:MAG: pitrilysin family protein [Acidobacteriota bacterium]